MAHEIETMAFANEVPWHGLGNRVDPNTSVMEMLDAAGLNWKVRQLPLFAQAEDGTMIDMPLRRALVRDSDNKVLSVTGDVWKPFQNEDALAFFREYTEIGGAKLETAGSLRGGKLIWALASIQAGFTVNSTDHTKGYILLISPHEVGKAISVRTTTVRVVCANTMAMAVNGSRADYKQNHLTDFNISAAKETIGLAREQVYQAELDAQALIQLKMSEFDTVRFLAKFFQPTSGLPINDEGVATLINDPKEQSKQLSEVLWAVNNGVGAVPNTGWGVLNGVTYWADHLAGRNNDARLFNSWLGERSRTKMAVYNELLELAA